MQHGLQHVLLVYLGPGPDGQLSDLEGGGAEPSHAAIGHVLLGLSVGNGAREVLVPGLLGEGGREGGREKEGERGREGNREGREGGREGEREGGKEGEEGGRKAGATLG